MNLRQFVTVIISLYFELFNYFHFIETLKAPDFYRPRAFNLLIYFIFIPYSTPFLRYIFLTTRWIRDFNPLETCVARCSINLKPCKLLISQFAKLLSILRIVFLMRIMYTRPVISSLCLLHASSYLNFSFPFYSSYSFLKETLPQKRHYQVL